MRIHGPASAAGPAHSQCKSLMRTNNTKSAINVNEHS